MRAFAVALLLLVASAVLAGYLDSRATPAPTQREARFDRIVSTCLPADEILLALHVDDPSRIVAVSHFADDPAVSNVVEEAAAVPHRVRGRAEEILALEPSVVFSFPFAAPNVQALLTRTGTPTRQVRAATSIDDVVASILELGITVDREAEANALTSLLRSELETVRGAAARRRVLVFSRGSTTMGRGTLMDELIHWVGAHNVARDAELEGHATIGVPTMMELDPDVILTLDYRADGRARVLAPNQLPRELNSLRAAREGQVHALDARHALTSSHHVFRLAQDLAHVLGEE